MRPAAWFLSFLAPLPALAQSAGVDFFETRIRPVLAAKCYACHGPKLKEPIAGLRVDSREALLTGGASGAALVPGNPAASKLYAAIAYTRLDLKMPPAGKLPTEAIEDFRRWIEMGAPAPAQAASAEAPKPADAPVDWNKAREYWAFRPVAKPPAPAVVNNAAWARTPVDRFLLEKLQTRSLTPAPEADRRVWLRRVTFDLTGLPPSPAELDAFVNDKSPRAYETVVERLLESPHYGERWARHWLDLMRFAETNGHEFDNDKLDAWRYRDYVIRAFNQDVGYDTFVREHIAGDLLAKPRIGADGALRESPLGTGFYWFGEVLNSATDSVKSRADQVDNQIDVIGKTFLGLTLACARCHDHKFDPLPTRDYYALAGILHSTGIREAVVDSPEREAAIRAAADAAAAPALLPRSPVALRPGDDLYADFSSGVPANWMISGEAYRSLGKSVQLTGSVTSPKFEMPKLWVHVKLRGNKAETGKGEKGMLRVTLVADDHKSAHLIPTGKPGWEWRSARMTKEIGRACYFEIVDRDRAGFLAVDKIVISDNEKPPGGDEDAAVPAALTDAPVPESAWGMVAFDEKPADVKLHIRGSHKNLGENVPRGMLRVMPMPAPRIETGSSGRLELAGWLASPDNPLTARVMVNRIWKHHFGNGLVRTADNFGKTGERPSHPELLDWLAATFVESGWSVKRMHRLIVLSSAYRMSSRAAAPAPDPRNDLLSYFPVRRLEAEAIRDSVLAVSGALNRTLYGPSVMPHISKYQDGRGKPVSGPLDANGRRSLYVQVRRNFVSPLFLAFDYPPPISTIGARGVSTVPSQALLMLNNEFVSDQAGRWAARLERDEPDPAQRLTRMYAEAFARPPQDWERRETLAFAEKSGWKDLAHALLNSAEFLYVQ